MLVGSQDYEGRQDEAGIFKNVDCPCFSMFFVAADLSINPKTYNSTFIRDDESFIQNIYQII